jgi:voltage-gated sodium channel
MTALQSTTNKAEWRLQLVRFTEQKRFERFIIAIIIINAITLGMETSQSIMSAYGQIISILDKTALSIFVVEIILRIVGHGRRFFRDPWSIFDFIVIGIALVPTSDQFSVLRSLRILRVLRLMSIVPQMRKVVSALLAAIPGLSSIILVLLLVYYVFAVMATNLFGNDFPEWFGSIASSMYTLFQVMTLESWSMGIVRPVMEKYPYAWMFFVPYILIATFTMLNLFIAIIVNAMQTQNAKETEAVVTTVETETHNVDEHVSSQIQELRTELKQMHELLQTMTKKNQ